MREREFTLIDGERVTRVPARVEGAHVRIAPDALEQAFGWTLKPQGLCKGDLCVTLRERRGLVEEDGIDLAVFAQTTGLPLALDVAERVAVLGASAAARGRGSRRSRRPTSRSPISRASSTRSRATAARRCC